MATFIVEHQNIFIPIIRWGVFFISLFLVLSPFLVIRHRIFKPSRWWHVVGAYISSGIILFLLELFIARIDQWLIKNAFNTVELFQAYEEASFKTLLWLIMIYPLLIFYSTRLLYGPFNENRFLNSIGGAIIFFVILAAIVAYTVVAGLGQIGMEHF